MTPAAPAASPRVLVLCQGLDLAGGVERFACGLANHLGRQGFAAALGSVDTPRSALAYAVDPAVRVLTGLAPAPGSQKAQASPAAAAVPLAGLPDAPDQAAPRRGPLRRHASLLRQQWRTGRALGQLIRAERPDVVILNGLTTACSVLLLHPGCAGRAVCCDHNHFDARSRPWRWLRARLYPEVAALVSLTETDAAKFRALNPRTEVIANASALRRADPPPADGEGARGAPGAPSLADGEGACRAPAAPPLVLAIGRCVAQKGFDLLLRAWQQVMRAADPAAPPGRLRIVGDGPLRASLQAEARRLGVEASVEWLPPTPDVARHYREAAVLVLPSRYEGLPLVLLEAQAMGLPAVAFDCPTGPAEIVTPDTGIVVPAEDVAALAEALTTLLGQPARRRRMGRAAWERSRAHFSAEAHFERWTALVRAVAGQTASPSATPPAGGRAAPRSALPQPASPCRTIPLREPVPGRVSVIVPCRNERRFLEAFCAGALAQALPPGRSLELLIADGASDDGSAELLQRLAAADGRIECVANPARIVSCGLNAALGRASGEVIVRMDVHTEYAADYLAACLATLAATGADNVGGPWHAEPEPGAGPTQRAVAAAFQSRWVAGGARSRDVDFDGWVDTVYLGCWPRATFERFGGFDETLVRNQDDEHNLRIRRGGGRIWQSASIRSRYRPRARLRQVFRQYLQYGYWKPFVMKKHGQPASLRHLVPGAFVAALAGAAVAAVVGGPRWPVFGLAVLYGWAVVAMTALVAGPVRLDAAATLRVPLAIGAYHFGYGVGSLLGLWDAARHGRGRSRFASLTR